jgi:ABC-type polysaccharide/polyol phosphate transport system ATPase subunit
MISDDWAVRVNSLGIKFFLRGKDGGGLRKEEFWALREVNFEVKKGEVFGIIGSNGSGKSTLLKIIAGIYPATEGRAEVRGKIAPFIELGAAFNPELTGAENIYLAGSIYRVPKRTIREKFDQIVEFSGLRKFIHTPVKNYSSGMFIRLAFSIIIFFEPDVVLIDEIFAVGDRVFQEKSMEKILSFREKGASMLIVSHDMGLIKQLCNRVAVLSRGRLAFLGRPEEAINFYLDLIKKGEGLENLGTQTFSPEQLVLNDARRWGNRQVEITRVEFVDEAGRPREVFRTGDYFEARISYINHGVDDCPVFGVAIYTIYRLLLYGPNTLENLGTQTFSSAASYSGQRHKESEKKSFFGPRSEQDKLFTEEPAPCESWGEREKDSKEIQGEFHGAARADGRPREPGFMADREGVEGIDFHRQMKLPRRGKVRFIIDSLPLLEGDYLFSASVYDSSLTIAYDHHEMMYFFRVKSPGISAFGAVRLESRWLISAD